MDKISAIIVEDEKKGMDKMVTMLTDYCPNVKIIEKCYTGKAAIQAIQKHRPHLVFLDIELGGMHGFDVLSSVPHISFELIITTAHEEYGVKAVKAGALDYLVKPFALEELKRAVHKAWNRIVAIDETENQRIILPETHGFLLLSVDDIIYCEADDNCSYIHLNNQNKPLFVVRTLGKINRQLPIKKFCRISRKHIINMDYFASYSRLDGGSVTLTNGKELPTRPGVFRKGLLTRLGNES